MTAVYVLRHPQTTWNVAERYQGRFDAPLSEQGQQQVPLLVSAFANQTIDAVYSSPLTRAAHLGGALAEAAHVPLQVDQRLVEIAMGPWEGLYIAEIRKRYADLYEKWYAHPEAVRFPGGEDLADVSARARSVLADAFVHFPTGHVVFVTHSVVVQVLAAGALGLDLHNIHRLRVSNGGITTLCGTECPGSLLSLNSTDWLYHSPVASAASQDCVSWKRRRVTQ